MSVSLLLNILVNASIVGNGGPGDSYNIEVINAVPCANNSCGDNEVYSLCGNNGCQNTCANPTFSQVCKGPCIPGCICKNGYLLNENLECVLESDCIMEQSHTETIIPCGINEVWNPCPQHCTYDESCEILLEGLIIVCAPHSPNWNCTGRCECAQGFVRIGETCQPPSACCSNPNEELVQCPNPCPGGTCEQPEFSPCSKLCQPWGCQCKEGYVKNGTDDCVSVLECNKTNICGKNEVWNDTPNPCWSDPTCKSIFSQAVPKCLRPPTIKPQDKSLQPLLQIESAFGRCECIEGFVRINGSCLPQAMCCSKPNEELVRCPNPCPGGTCEQPEFAPCRKLCQFLGCQCKEGYVKNGTDDCIPVHECIKPCGDNEVWNPCPHQHCVYDNTCETLLEGLIIDCGTPPPNWKCTGRCECTHGFLRLNETCQPPSACCTSPHTVLVDCPNPCPGGTCSQPFFSDCNLECPSMGCQCETGYVKDNNGQCVLLSDCSNDEKQE